MRRRNPIARQLHSPRYRKRVVAMKTSYNRKKTEKENLVEDRRQEVEDRSRGRRPSIKDEVRNTEVEDRRNRKSKTEG